MNKPWLDIWALDLTKEPTPAALSDWANCLSPAELSSSQLYRDTHRRTQAISSRALLRHALSYRTDKAPTLWNIRQEDGGRPFLDPGSEHLDFNVSHTNGLVVCAVSNGFPVGVDVEHKKQARIIREFEDRFLSPLERNHYRACGAESSDAFIVRLWTLKEAFAKATGQGLQLDFTSIIFDVSKADSIKLISHSGWNFRSLSYASGHIVSVAWKSTDQPILSKRDGADLLGLRT